MGRNLVILPLSKSLEVTVLFTQVSSACGSSGGGLVRKVSQYEIFKINQQEHALTLLFFFFFPAV